MKLRKNLIIVQPLGGLCNRMRTIAGAVDLANRLNRQVVVIWTSDPTLNAPYKLIFDTAPFKIIECKLPSCKYRFYYHYYKDVLGYHIIDDTWIIANCRGNSSDWINDLKDIYIYSCQNITLSDDFTMFSLSPVLRQRINADICDNNTIGIHIRRTDNLNSIKYSPTSSFIKKIEEELQENSKAKFYLATDDKNEELELVERFGNHIITYKKEALDRNNSKAIQDAAIDLYHLAQCKKIYASYFSSFSDVAALWGGV